MQRPGNTFKNLLLMLGSILFILAMAEVVLRIADYPRQPMKPEKIKDPILVYKIPSDWPGTDRNGFRNHGVPTQADIVTIGDSHTYGLNADIETNWPGQLAKLTGKKVYNYGIGGYGPLQYFYLFEQALALKPETIVIGLYLPNDIAGFCHPYLKTDYWKRNPPLDADALDFCKGQNYSEEEAGAEKITPGLEAITDVFVNSKLGVLVSITSRRLRGHLPKNEERNIVVDDELNQTIIGKSRIRALSNSMDLQKSIIANSLGATKALLMKMKALGKAHNTQMMVLVIPSREFVFFQYLSGKKTKLPQIYQTLYVNESRLRDNVFQWLTDSNIPFVDTAPALLNAVSTKGGVYPQDNDGHPLPTGYAVYANSLYEKLFKTH